MAKLILKILRCSQRKIFKVCLPIFQHYSKVPKTEHIQGNNFNYLKKAVVKVRRYEKQAQRDK